MSPPNETFGKLLRSLRLESGVGLRELSRLIEKSPGYLSDVESGNVPAPSEETIVQIANALNVDKKVLLNAAKKIDPELSEYVAEQPQVADFLRMAKDQEFNDDDWDRLTQLAKLSKLGKEGRWRKMKVTWLPKSGIEAIAGDVLSGYEEMIGAPVAPPIPVEDIVERYLDLRIGFMDFEKTYGFHGVLGAIYVKGRLICADNTLLEDRSEGRLNFTFAHEAGHWVLHRKFVVAAGDSRAERTAILCRKKDAKKPVEWQADYFAACLLMPEKWIKSAFEKSIGREPLCLHNEQRSLINFIYVEPCVCNWPFIAQAIQKTGGFSNVSKQAIIIRLQELGLVINETTAEIGWHRKQYAT